MKTKIRIGIDPGLKGFISVYKEKSDKYEFYPIPTFNNDAIDMLELNSLMSEIVPIVSFFDVHAVLEDVHSIYGASSSSTFKFGYVLGIIEMCLVAHNIPYTKVQPKTWQKEMWQGIKLLQKPSSTGKTNVTNTKLMSITACKRLFPTFDLRKSVRCKVPDDNKCDSLLMLEYCKRKF